MTHQRLLDIAIAEFGAKGLDGASTREIAAAAGTVMSAITYHFGGKEGLYLAAASHIGAQIGDHMASPAPDEDAALPTPAAARALIRDTLSTFIDMMASEESHAWSKFIVREQMEPTEAFERIYGGAMGQTLRRLVDLVCIATGRHDAGAAQVTVITLVGQVVALRASRGTCLKLLGRDTIDNDSVAAIKHRILANTDAILDRMIAERQELP